MTTKYPQEIDRYIRDQAAGHTTYELTELINSEFKTKYTREQIRAYMKNHRIRNGVNCTFQKGQEPYTKGKKWAEYMSPKGQENCRKNTYKKGNTPENVLPLGSVRKTPDGYLIIKVQSRGGQWDRWKLLQQKVWEDEHGPVPEGHVLTFKDGNRENVTLDNLVLVTQEENAMLTTLHYRSEIPELTESGLATVRLKVAIREKRKRKKKEGRQ